MKNKLFFKNKIFLSGLMVFLMFLLIGCSSSDSLPIHNVALFTNATYVDYEPGDSTAEASNLEATVQGFGMPVHTFTGITSDSFIDATANRKALLIPEMENGDLNAALDDDARAAIADFVDAGGNLIVFYPGRARELALLNDTFGWSLEVGPETTSLSINAADAAGTQFVFCPATLPWNDETYNVDITSLPAEAKVIYIDDDTGDAGVVVIPYGNGNVIIIGWDWCDAAPVGSQDDGWRCVLFTAINI